MPEFQPRLDKEFQCIGPQCEDLCCRVWNVVVDKATYQKYESTPALQPMVKDHLVRIANSRSDSKYAQIKFELPTRTCALLDSDRWCSIHKNFGPSYLPPVCNMYPRLQDPIEGMTVRPLLLSCPEAARLVLFQKEFVPFERNTHDDRPRYQRFLRMANDPLKTNGKVRKHLSDIQAFSLLLLHDRAFPLWQRLLMIGMMSKRLTEILVSKQLHLVPPLLAEYADMVRQQRLSSSMEAIPVQAADQLRLVIEITHRLQERSVVFPRMQECIRDFMAGIDYDAQKSIYEMSTSYVEAHDRYYRAFFDQHPTIFENYVSNYFFRTEFPQGPIPPGEPNTPLTAFWLLCLQYAVLKGLLIGVAGHYRETFGSEHVVKVIQSFSKIVEHSNDLLMGLNQDLASAGGMALLLKN